VLLEKETVLGDELDQLILELRPGFDFPSKHERPAPETSEGKANVPPSPEASASEPDNASDAAGDPDTPPPGEAEASDEPEKPEE